MTAVGRTGGGLMAATVERTEERVWAKLRQVIIGTAHHDSDVAAVRESLALGEPFADPEIHELSLVDATFQVSPERYLELVGTTSPTSPMAMWLGKVGPRAGYALSVQHPDPDAVRARCIAAGLRVAIDTVAFGKTVLQLHPKDFGLLLEVDGIDDPDVWFWDDISPGPSATAGIDEVIGVEIPAGDPALLADRWSDVLGIGAPSADHQLDLGGAWVRFIPDDVSREWVVTLRRSSAAASAPELEGVAFRLV